MEPKFVTLLFISFSSILLLFPATQCNMILASSPSPAPGPSFDPKSLSRAKPHSTAFRDPCAFKEDQKPCKSSIVPKWLANPGAALEIEIKALLVVINNTIVKLNKVDKDPSTSANSRKCLDKCLKNYNSAKDDLTEALKAIAAKDLERLQSEVSGSIADLGSCEKTFVEMGIKLPLDKALVAILHKLADNCIKILELIK